MTPEDDKVKRAKKLYCGCGWENWNWASWLVHLSECKTAQKQQEIKSDPR